MVEELYSAAILVITITETLSEKFGIVNLTRLPLLVIYEGADNRLLVYPIQKKRG